MATSISANGATQYVSLRMNTGIVEYSTDQSTYTPIAATANWPVTITNSNPGASTILRVVAIENLTLTSGYGNTSGYLSANSQYITFDGSGNTITLDGITDYPGFITNNSNGFIAVNNFTTTTSGGSTLGYGAGWLCQAFFANASSLSITNCTNNGNVNNTSCGGVVGRFFGAYPGWLRSTITGCTNNGTIDGDTTGGIAGENCAYNGGLVTITNCVNNGNITAANFAKGGIVAGQCGTAGASVIITGCTNSGNIACISGGGITGSGCGNGASITITGCTNSGLISGGNSGGITGGSPGYNGGSATINSCTNTSTGTISGSNTGGISGYQAGQGGSVTFTNCTNNALISGNEAGGIAGNSAGQGGSATFTNCTNTGNITGGNGAGGIAGTNVGFNSGLATFTGCTNSGNISSGGMGGIAGSGAGSIGGSVNFTRCTNSGNIPVEAGGGITGSGAGSNAGSCTITNCSNSGTISGIEAGGIVGQNAGFTDGLCNITSCFSTGAITGRTSGGITGNQMACNTNQPCTITQCYSTGDITGTNAGGITGGNVGRSANVAYSPVVNITNSYSLGIIANSTGGICGGLFDGGVVYSNPATINITNSYSFGAISGTGNGLVAVSLTTPNITLNTSATYIANNAWSDATANASLTGDPLGVGIPNKGTTWTSISADTPYLLSSYWLLTNPTQVYTPNNVVTSALTYSSVAGSYSPGIYSIQSSSQVDYTLTTNVAAIAGTSPKYYGYANNIYTITTSSGRRGPITASINGSSGVLEFSLAPPYPCFLEGTQILCFENNQEVYRPVQSLRKGDLVKTIYNGYLPIHMIGTTAMYNPNNNDRIASRLYKCPKENYPGLFEDLYITGCHSILVPWLSYEQGQKTIAALGRLFVTDKHCRLMAWVDEKAEPYKMAGVYNIYHIALENENYYMNYGIYANGLLVESCSKRYLTEMSNMRILGEEDTSLTEGVSAEENVFHKMPEMIETC